MEINWFTFTAQVINFLILVFLLQRFLYEPIIKVINQRKQRIQGQLLEAEQQIIKAQQQEQQYLTLTEELENRKKQIIQEAQAEAQAEKARLLKIIKMEVEASKKLWEQNLKLEQEQFLKTLQNQANEQLFKVIRKILNDLANQDLESAIIEVFLNNLSNLELETKTKIIEKLNDDPPLITVQTSFNLNEEKQQIITDNIQQIFNYQGVINYETEQDLLCGINLTIGGEELNWSLIGYLHELELNLHNTLQSKG